MRADPEQAWRTLDRLELALMVCERATGRFVLVNDRGVRLLRSLGAAIDRLPSMLATLLEGGDQELDSAGTRFSSTALDDDELVLLTALPAADPPAAAHDRVRTRVRQVALGVQASGQARVILGAAGWHFRCSCTGA